MKIPKSVKIGGHTVPVKKTKNLSTTASAYGLYDPSNLEIHLDHSLSGSHEQEVFWHECVEAINDMFEMGIEHRNIQALGVLLLQLYKSVEEQQ